MIFVGVLLLLRLLLLLLFLLLFLLPALAEDNRCEAAINSNSSRWVIATSPGAIDQLPATVEGEKKTDHRRERDIYGGIGSATDVNRRGRAAQQSNAEPATSRFSARSRWRITSPGTKLGSQSIHWGRTTLCSTRERKKAAESDRSSWAMVGWALQAPVMSVTWFVWRIDNSPTSRGTMKCKTRQTSATSHYYY